MNNQLSKIILRERERNPKFSFSIISIKDPLYKKLFDNNIRPFYKAKKQYAVWEENDDFIKIAFNKKEFIRTSEIMNDIIDKYGIEGFLLNSLLVDYELDDSDYFSITGRHLDDPDESDLLENIELYKNPYNSVYFDNYESL